MLSMLITWARPGGCGGGGAAAVGPSPALGKQCLNLDLSKSGKHWAAFPRSRGFPQKELQSQTMTLQTQASKSPCKWG